VKLAVFLERDGVLNRVRVEGFQQVPPLTFDEFELKPGVASLLQELKAAGFLLLVTTNQPGLSEGRLPRRELDRMHEAIRRELPVDDLFVCPHSDADGCTCRKPHVGLFIEAAFKWHLDLEHSFVLSDKWPDARAAAALGCTSILIRSPWNRNCRRDFTVPSMAEAVKKILQLHARSVAPYQKP
jgi:D-glycero-D-manno-heptose 1,7-bisphosphate phosphatase